MDGEMLGTPEIIDSEQALDSITEAEDTVDTDPAEMEEQVDSGSAKKSETTSNKAHLSSSVPRAAKVPLGAITKQEMAEIRMIFGDMDDAEIQRLYKKVTK